MTMLGTEFQDTAERLARGTTEADWRSAMSRGYYAAFHFFREFLASQGIGLGKAASAHATLYMGLLNCGFPQVAALGRDVDTLREERTWADYRLTLAVVQPDADRVTQGSARVVRDFQALLTTLGADKIADGVRTYLRSISRLFAP
jgi:hypothetical protein